MSNQLRWSHSVGGGEKDSLRKCVYSYPKAELWTVTCEALRICGFCLRSS